MMRKKYIRDATEEMLLTHPLDDVVAILDRKREEKPHERDNETETT